MTPEHYTFRPSMFFEGRYQVVDAKGTPIGAARDLSDAETITRSLNKAGREQVEPLEAWKESAIKVLGEWDKVHEALGKPGKLGESMAAASLAEVQKLRALVQVLVDGCNEAIEMQQAQRGCISDAEVNLPTCMNGFSTAKEAGFTPTTDEVR